MNGRSLIGRLRRRMPRYWVGIVCNGWRVIKVPNGPHGFYTEAGEYIRGDLKLDRHVADRILNGSAKKITLRNGSVIRAASASFGASKEDHGGN